MLLIVCQLTPNQAFIRPCVQLRFWTGWESAELRQLTV